MSTYTTNLDVQTRVVKLGILEASKEQYPGSEVRVFSKSPKNTLRIFLVYLDFT